MNIADLEGKIINADCMDILKELPNKAIDLILTDPPYGGGAICGKVVKEGVSAGGLTNTISVARTGGTWSKKYQKGGHFNKVHRQNSPGGKWKNYDNGSDIRHWDIAPEQSYFEEMFRVSKEQIIWGGNYFNLPPTRCFNIWKKLTISENFSMAMAEYAWVSCNKNAKLWEFAPQDSKRFHPTQKPVKLIEKQLLEYSKEGDLILDPFSGSGTTAIACHRLKRRFICIEKDPEYWAKSVERLKAEQAQLQLF